MSKELAALKEKLLDREKELDAREAAISLEVDSLEKQKDELSNISLDLASKREDFDSRRDVVTVGLITKIQQNEITKVKEL